MSSATPSFKQLNVAIVGGGLGGLAAAIALRRAGHLVSIYERRDFKLEVGASISCAANGGQWLREWGVDISSGRPTNLMKLVMRDWKTGKILNQYSLEEYEATWGIPYYMFHRVDMHDMLLKTATQVEGEGTPCSVVVDHIATGLDAEAGTVTFANGVTVHADLVIGADGIRSSIRSLIGVTPDTKSANQTCYRCNVKVADIEKLGLVGWAADPAIQFWGGFPTDDLSRYYKIVMSPCAGGEIVSFYCFMPTEMTNHTKEGFTFAEVPVSDLLAGDYSSLDPDCVGLIKNSIDRMPWRLYVHQPYPHWVKGVTAVLGDAAHPMMPHQSQGACAAIEDAAALGIIFSKDFGYTTDVKKGLEMYQHIRKPRATRVQSASARATENLNERIGFTSLSAPEARLKAAEGELTVNEMNNYDMRAHITTEAATFQTAPTPVGIQAQL
jgi:salicylate hydroxylase